MPNSAFSAASKIPSSSEMISTYFWNKLTVQVWSFALNCPLDASVVTATPTLPV